MEEAPENGKGSSNSARANGMNEMKQHDYYNSANYDQLYQTVIRI